MSDPTLVAEEVLGVVRDEHYDPRAKRDLSSRIQVERNQWSDHTFYTLYAMWSDHREGVDLDREGWRQLRALCDAVIARMDQEGT